MNLILGNMQTYGSLAGWCLLWMLGGIWITRSVFFLRKNEYMIVGFAIGFVIENWLANIIGQLLPLPFAFWLAATVVFLLGLFLTLPSGFRSLFKFEIQMSQWISLAALTYIFILVNRGLAIFDDYAHLPTTSLIAAGSIPPHFALNPDAPYGYHYFLLLFSAQLVRLGDIFPWTALDLARGLSVGLAVQLVSLWVQRLTFSKLAGFFGGLFALFGMGTRWLLLFIPKSILQGISNNVQMIGSGAQTAPDFLTALTSPWIIEGGGPFAYPFSFISGINQPWILAMGPNGLIDTAITFPLLLTFNRWKNWKAGLISVILLSSSALVSETGMPLLVAGWGLITLIYIINKHTFHIPDSMRNWWIVISVYVLVSVTQGGAWSEIFKGGILSVAGVAPQDSYQTIGFKLVWPPTLVSSHLGALSLINPRQLLVALVEIGPVLLTLPLVFAWGIKAFRASRWFESSLILSGLLAILLLFVQFTGSAGVRNTSRLYSFIGLASMWAIPLVWRWAASRSSSVKTILGSVGTIIVFGGIVLFGIELIAAQKPVLPAFITPLDVRIQKEFWNKFDTEALIFDPIPYRSPTIFGRYTNSSVTWLVAKPDWEIFLGSPDPHALSSAGFGYVYFDYVFWYDIDMKYKEIYNSDPCVLLLKEQKDKRSADFRRLYDIRECKR